MIIVENGDSEFWAACWKSSEKSSEPRRSDPKRWQPTYHQDSHGSTRFQICDWVDLLLMSIEAATVPLTWRLANFRTFCLGRTKIDKSSYHARSKS